MAKQEIETTVVVTPEESTQVPALASGQSLAVSQTDRLIELAITSDASVEKLEKLLELKERYDREEARKAFTAALAAFKGEGITIDKDKVVRFANNDGSETVYSHASLGNIIEIATPALSKNGLSHRWVTEQDRDFITVTCILTHKDGHSEQTSWSAYPDDSGKKNTIQKVASTVTYLERYTFLAITGLATKDMPDDDGRASESPPKEPETITEDQSNWIHAFISENELNMSVFKKWLRSAFKTAGVREIEDLPAQHFEKVTKKLSDTLGKKKAKK